MARLKLNREKTRIVNLRRSQERLEFLGYQIGLAPVRDDRRRRYWRMEPSHKAMEREVARIWQMTSRQQGWKPLPELIGELNRHLKGYFSASENPQRPFAEP
jgi:RNA-directed DNA polymerase